MQYKELFRHVQDFIRGWKGNVPQNDRQDGQRLSEHLREELHAMDLESIVKTLNLGVRSGKDKLKAEVGGGYTGDLLSDVMGNSKAGDIWITRQIHQNIVAVASLKEHAAIIIVEGCEPPKETLDKATKEGIPILISDLSAFELTGRIYNLIKPLPAERR